MHNDTIVVTRVAGTDEIFGGYYSLTWDNSAEPGQQSKSKPTNESNPNKKNIIYHYSPGLPNYPIDFAVKFGEDLILLLLILFLTTYLIH
ncbi:hypothetical protein Glove_33g8 [Diversispora epigaea]|uniref:TLDc domain-containing protein n=1 Tax=Diversispora epigaea TaxID=1348612 RepID=A0A397JRH3_9GLOM|nr:hypothetical protein Glove_33g8 [Diversispora epigaea]